MNMVNDSLIRSHPRLTRYNFTLFLQMISERNAII